MVGQRQGHGARYRASGPNAAPTHTSAPDRSLARVEPQVGGESPTAPPPVPRPVHDRGVELTRQPDGSCYLATGFESSGANC